MEGQDEPQQHTHVGGLLRAYRLRAQKRLEDLAPQLHIRQAFLEAIENGRYELLPGPVYAQGFVRAYAESLGLDGEAVAAHFKREIAGWSAESPLCFPAPPAESETPKGGVMLLGLLITIIAYGTWYAMTSSSIETAQRIAPLPERLGGSGAPVMGPFRTPDAPLAGASTAEEETVVQLSAASNIPVLATASGTALGRGVQALHAVKTTQTEQTTGPAATDAAEPVVAARASAVEGAPMVGRGEDGAVHRGFPLNPKSFRGSIKTAASQ